MSTVTVIDREGQEHTLEATEGWSLMEILREAGLPIEAACGGCAACATCHVYIDESWASKVSPADDEENDMLDLALDVQDTSRLSCQIRFKKDLNGLKVTLAPE